MKRLLFILMLIPALVFSQAWDSTKTTDTPRGGMYKFNAGIKGYILGKKADTTGISGFSHPIMVLQGDSLWVAKEGIEVGADSGYVTFMVDDDSLVALKRTDLTNSLAAINRSLLMPVLNVKSYGATGDGVTNDRTAIQTVLNSLASTSQPVTVYIPEGTYIIEEDSLPSELPGYSKNGIAIPSNVTLQGAGINKTILKLADGTATYDTVNNYGVAFVRNYHPSDGDSNIIIRGMTIDLNGENQQQLTAYDSANQQGLRLDKVTKCLVEDVLIKGVWGTQDGPPGESNDFNFNGASHCVARRVFADGTYHASSGIGSTSSIDLTFEDCYSWGHNVVGIGSWNGRQIRFINCYAWGNSYGGWNMEYCDDISYINCFAGAKIRNSYSHDMYPYTFGDTLANAHGFILNLGSGHHYFVNCIAEYNTLNGIQAGGVNSITVIGGSFSYNTGYGIRQDSALFSADGPFQLMVWGTKVVGNFAGTHQIGTQYNAFVDDTSYSMMYSTAGLETPPTEYRALIAASNGTIAPGPVTPKITLTLADGPGWYRLVKDSTNQLVAADIRLYGTTGNNIFTDVKFNTTMMLYADASTINMEWVGPYNGSHVDSIRVGADTSLTGDSAFYAVLDVKFSDIDSGTTLNIMYSGSIQTPSVVEFNPTPPNRLGAQMNAKQYGNSLVGENLQVRDNHFQSIVGDSINISGDLDVGGIPRQGTDTLATKAYARSLTAGLGGGDIEGVTATAPITGGGTTGTVTVGIDTAAALAYVKSLITGKLSASDSTSFLAYIKYLDGLKSPIASPTFTGTVTLPTGLTGTIRASSGVVSATASDTVGQAAALAAKAPLASPSFTGTVSSAGAIENNSGSQYLTLSDDLSYTNTFTLRKKRATADTTLQYDYLGNIAFQGHGGNGYKDGAIIRAYALSKFSPTSSPATIVFLTTPTGSTTPATRMEIGSGGEVDVYGTFQNRGSKRDLNKAAGGWLNTVTRNTTGSELVLDYDYVGSITQRTNTGSTTIDSMKVVSTDTLAFWVGGARFVAIKNP